MKRLLTRFFWILACWVPSLGWFAPVDAVSPSSSLVPGVVAARKLAATPADSAIAAAKPIVLKGTVLLPTGQPCAGASVHIVGAPYQLVVTNAQGLFSLPVPTGAAITLYVDYFGEGVSRIKVSFPVTQPLRIILGQ